MIDALLRDLSSLPQVQAIALGGSRAGDVFDAASDYDVYLYCTAPFPKEERRAILSRYCTVMELGNHFWEYEDNCILQNGIPIDILYRNLTDFTHGVAAVVEQYQASNGYTTCMWHNLLTCRILYDRDDLLTAAKARFDVPYPPQLRQNIIERNMRLLSDALPAYQLQLAKAIHRGDQVSIGHRTAAFMESYFDILFALNSLTHPGEKRLVSLCKERCTLLPERFEENIQQLYADLFTHPDKAEEDIDRIVQALKRIL